MAPNAFAKKLLYVSDGADELVAVYAWPGGKLVGQLRNLSEPAGLCSDATGHVWVVESETSTLAKYGHGITKRLVILKDTGALHLWGCGVNVTSGNLAVTDLGGPSGGAGVWVYPGGKGPPTKYKDPKLDEAFFCGYDATGNLFVDGVDESGNFQLFELPQGSSTLSSVTLNTSIEFPGGIAWDGEYLAVGDQLYNSQHSGVIYQVFVAGSSGTIEGTTALSDSCDVGQFALNTASGKNKLQATAVIAPDTCQHNARVYVYPEGGSSTRELDGLELLSLLPKRTALA